MKAKTKFLLVFFSLIVLALLGLLIFGFYSVRAKNQNTSDLINETDQETQGEALARDIKIAQNIAKDNLVALDALTLSQTKLIQFIDLVQNAGKSLGLKTSIDAVSVEKGSATDSQAPDKIHITVSTTGAWSKTLTFTHLIESLPYRIAVDSSALAKLGDSSLGWSSRTAMTLYSFTQ